MNAVLRLGLLATALGFCTLVVALGSEVPGPGLIAMRCAHGVHCGQTTQTESCLNLRAGASCSFCSGDNVVNMCVFAADRRCITAGSSPACGRLVHGLCQVVGGALVCTGSTSPDTCSVIGCTGDQPYP